MRLHHPRRRRGRALRRPRARAGRRRAALHRHAASELAGDGRDFEAAFVASCTTGPLMRWLLLKDLQILRRSPLLVALLVIYPVVVAVLFGSALSGGPGEAARGVREPRPGDAHSSSSAARRSTPPTTPSSSSSRSTRSASTRARRRSRRSATARRSARSSSRRTRSERLQGMLALGGGEPPTVEVFYNAEDPVKRRYVESTIRVAAGRRQRGAVRRGAARSRPSYLDLVVKGGKLSLPLVGDVADPRAAQRADAHRQRRSTGLPDGRAAARAARAGQPLRPPGGREPRLSQADPGLDRPAGAGQADGRRRAPARRSTVRGGGRRDALADVRDAAAGRRPARARARGAARSGGSCAGSCRRTALLTEKIVLAALCAFVVTLLMLRGPGRSSSASTGAARRWLPRWRRRARASPRWASAIGGAGARGAGRRRCWRSCSRCRSRSWRWCRPARSTPASTTRSTSSPARSRSSRRCGRSTGEQRCALVHLLGAGALVYGGDRRALALRRF